MITMASPNHKYIINSLMKLKKFMLMIIHVVWLHIVQSELQSMARQYNIHSPPMRLYECISLHFLVIILFFLESI